MEESTQTIEANVTIVYGKLCTSDKRLVDLPAWEGAKEGCVYRLKADLSDDGTSYDVKESELIYEE